MPFEDFRIKPYSVSSIINSGKYAGNRFYSKLFVIENIIRVIINSILRKEYPSHLDWWNVGIPRGIKKPWHSLSSRHGIYHTYLLDLNRIMVHNRNLIDRHITNLDSLILDIELFNIPRRKIAHTKYLNTNDIQRLDNLYNKSKLLINEISKRIDIEIP